MKKINPFLWFDSEAEQAAKFYVGIFKNSMIGNITHYAEDGRDRRAA
jgi:predicted 3-demethylubiquinone-9 3-methyltransferase (glyoxalase superfamily)